MRVMPCREKKMTPWKKSHLRSENTIYEIASENQKPGIQPLIQKTSQIIKNHLRRKIACDT